MNIPSSVVCCVVCSDETDVIHQLSLAMRIMVVSSPTLLSLSWFVLLRGGVSGGAGAGTVPPGDVVIHGTPRNIQVAKRFYEPDVTYYSQLMKNQRPADLDFVDFLLGDEQKRAEERHHHHHRQTWDPQMDFVDFLIGHDMGGPSEWKQPFYQRSIPDELKARMVLTTREPQTVKFKPFYNYEEILRRRKRSKENSNAIDEWKNQKNVKGTGLKDEQSGTSAIANSLSSEGRSQSYGNTRGVFPSVDSTAQLDDMATCRPQQPGTDLFKSSGGMEKREENGERLRSAFNRGNRPSYEEFILGEKRPTEYQNDYQKPAAVKPPREMTYDEFLFGEKHSQQQQQSQSATVESQFGSKDKSFLQKQPAYDEFLLGDKRNDEPKRGSLHPSGNKNRPVDQSHVLGA